MSWQDYIKSWAPGWTDLLNTTLTQHRASIEANPQKYTKEVQNMMRELDLARHRLLMLQGKLAHPAATEQDQQDAGALMQRFNELAAGVYAHVKAQGEEPQVEGVPLIIGGLIFGVAAIAWSIAAYEYATYLSNDTMLKDKELDARIQASEEGRTLQPSTLPEKPDIENKASKWIPWVSMGGVGVTALLALLYSLRKGM